MSALKNARHERFAQELAKGTFASEAYELAGFKPSSGNAATLKAKQSILERVNELIVREKIIEAKATEKAVEALALDTQWVLSRLMKNAKIALGEEAKPDGEKKYNGAVANGALEALGRHLGLFKERVDLNINDARAPEESALELIASRIASLSERLREEDGPRRLN